MSSFEPRQRHQCGVSDKVHTKRNPDLYLFVPNVVVFSSSQSACIAAWCVCVKKRGTITTDSILAEAQLIPWANLKLPFQMRSLSSPRILMTFTDVFNNFFPFCWVLMDSVLLGWRWRCQEGVGAEQRTRQGGRWVASKADGDWERESGRDLKSSVILIPLAESCESIILHLSFILPLLSGNGASPRPVRHLLMQSGLKGSLNSKEGTRGMQGRWG